MSESPDVTTELVVIHGHPELRISRTGVLQFRPPEPKKRRRRRRRQVQRTWRTVRPHPASGSGLFRWRPYGSRGSWFWIHRLVYEAWVGPIPLDSFPRHADGDLTNNAPENLVLERYSDARLDWMRRTGRLAAGYASPVAADRPPGVRRRAATLDDLLS